MVGIPRRVPGWFSKLGTRFCDRPITTIVWLFVLASIGWYLYDCMGPTRTAMEKDRDAFIAIRDGEECANINTRRILERAGKSRCEEAEHELSKYDFPIYYLNMFRKLVEGQLESISHIGNAFTLLGKVSMVVFVIAMLVVMFLLVHYTTKWADNATQTPPDPMNNIITNNMLPAHIMQIIGLCDKNQNKHKNTLTF